MPVFLLKKRPLFARFLKKLSPFVEIATLCYPSARCWYPPRARIYKSFNAKKSPLFQTGVAASEDGPQCALVGALRPVHGRGQRQRRQAPHHLLRPRGLPLLHPLPRGRQLPHLPRPMHQDHPPQQQGAPGRTFANCGRARAMLTRTCVWP